MRLIAGFFLIAGVLLPGVTAAQVTLTPFSPCIPPPPGRSCQQLHCVGACSETWVNGACQGGVCAQGYVASKAAGAAPGTELTIHNVTPTLEKKIRTLLNAK